VALPTALPFDSASAQSAKYRLCCGTAFPADDPAVPGERLCPGGEAPADFLRQPDSSATLSRRTSPEVLRQLIAGRVPTRALNTHRGSIAEAPALLQQWLRPEAGMIKVSVEI
jgi:hypothetical protein